MDLLKPSRGFVFLQTFKQPSEEVLTAKRPPSCSGAVKRRDLVSMSVPSEEN